MAVPNSDAALIEYLLSDPTVTLSEAESLTRRKAGVVRVPFDIDRPVVGRCEVGVVAVDPRPAADHVD